MSRPTRLHRGLVSRRDAEGTVQVAQGWEPLVERLIREAQEEGRFDDLPGHGQPIRLEDDVHAGDMALAHHVLRNAAMAPPWIEADKEVRAIRSAIEMTLATARRTGTGGRGRLRRRLEDLLDAHDAAIHRLASLAPTPRQYRHALDRVEWRSRLGDALAGMTPHS